jgi:hypothetical protein
VTAGAQGRWPNLLIIGAHKAGTTSLHRYLAAHPDIQMSDHKEISYFAGPTSDVRLVSRWQRGPDWYQGHFPGAEKVHGEASTSYANHPHTPGVPQRIHDAVPDVKIIYAVRDPRDRLMSHYLHVRGLGRERRTLPQLLRSPDVLQSAYVMRSRYWHQLSQYLEWFDPAQIRVVGLGELATARPQTLSDLFAFLGVDPEFTTAAWDDVHNQAHRFPLMEALGRVFDEPTMYRMSNEWHGVRRVLNSVSRPQRTAPAVPEAAWDPVRDVFAQDAAQLRRFTGQAFADWSV